MSLVVDTSVALKWVVPEEGSADALKLIRKPIVAPDLLAAELGNALWKKVRRGEASVLQALAGYDTATAFLALLPTAPFRRAALELALELDHPVYDCFFLALAEQQSATLVTADTRLLRKVEGTSLAHLVVQLGAFQG